MSIGQTNVRRGNGITKRTLAKRPESLDHYKFKTGTESGKALEIGATLVTPVMCAGAAEGATC